MNDNSNNKSNTNRRVVRSSSDNKGCLIIAAIILGLFVIGLFFPKDGKKTPQPPQKVSGYFIIHKGDNGFKTLFEIEVPKPMLESDLDKIGREMEAKEEKPVFIRFYTADSKTYNWGVWATYDESNHEGANIVGFTLEQMEESLPISTYKLKPNYKAAWILNIAAVPKVYVLSGDSMTIIHKDLTYHSHKVEAFSESMFKREYETYYIENNGDMSIISAEGKKQYTCKKVKF